MNLYTSALRLSTFRHNILLLGTSTQRTPKHKSPSNHHFRTIRSTHSTYQQADHYRCSPQNNWSAHNQSSTTTVNHPPPTTPTIQLPPTTTTSPPRIQTPIPLNRCPSSTAPSVPSPPNPPSPNPYQQTPTNNTPSIPCTQYHTPQSQNQYHSTFQELIQYGHHI